MADISVSRFHAYIKYENGQFNLFDNHSKFGTLVHLNKEITVGSEKIALQVGRSVMTFAVKNMVLEKDIVKPLYQVINEEVKTEGDMNKEELGLQKEILNGANNMDIEYHVPHSNHSN